LSLKIKPINVIIIDDEKEYCMTLKNVAKEFGILLTDFQNLEDGFQVLEESYKYKGIILDGKCLLDPNQETPRDVFITQALRRLDRIQMMKERTIPAIINSAYIDDLEHMLPDDIQRYDKGKNNKEMFQFLRAEINKTEEMQLINKYAEPYSIFESEYLDSNVERDFVVTIKHMNNNDSVSINNNLARMRTILEAIYKKMNQINKTVVPDHFFEGNNVYVRGILKHLSGNPEKNTSQKWVITSEVFQPRYIGKLVDSIYSVTSDEGSHHSENQPSRFTVISNVNSLCEIIIWFGKWMEEQTTNTDIT
jgi:vacuolar-type H+-ATPase catalytic subunit A/Vma1